MQPECTRCMLRGFRPLFDMRIVHVMGFGMSRCRSTWSVNMNSMSQEPILIMRRREVERRTGLSRSTIYERIRTGAFPAPISLGGKSVGWIEHEVNHWLAERVVLSRTRASAGVESR